MEVRGNYEVFPISQTIHEPSIDGLSIVDEDIQQEPGTKLTRQELIERYATIHKISYEEAELEVGAPTEEEILKNIHQKTVEKINSTHVPMNRAQRRALKKKMGAKKYAELVANGDNPAMEIVETAKKLSYVDLIQKLRRLNEEKEKNGETVIEDDGCMES